MLSDFATYIDAKNPVLADKIDNYLIRIAMNQDVDNYHAEHNANFYQLLGVSPTAENADLKAAYRRLVQKHHPDVSNHPRAKDIVQALNLAHGVLINPADRNMYDQYLAGGGASQQKAAEEAMRKQQEAAARTKAEQERYRKMQDFTNKNFNEHPPRKERKVNRAFEPSDWRVFNDFENEIAANIENELMKRLENGGDTEFTLTANNQNKESANAILAAAKKLSQFSNMSISYNYKKNFIGKYTVYITCRQADPQYFS